MIETRIQFDLQCEWDLIEPAYRIYFNDELITERNYSSKLINVSMFVLASNSNHTLSIEPLEPKSGTFVIKNFTVDNYEGLDVSGIKVNHTVR